MLLQLPEMKYILGVEGTDGQLGNGPDSSANTPQKLQVSFDEPYEKFVDIKTSVNYCIALTNKGNVYSWGRNASGQLGMEIK